MGFLVGRTQRTQSRSLKLSDVAEGRAAGRSPGQPATPSQAMRFSAVWAALRLRADLLSTLPVDVFRKVGDAQVPAPTTRLFRVPSADMLWPEWAYSSQMDLDRYGNCFGHIVARETGYATQVELWPASEVSVLLTGQMIRAYRFQNREYQPSEVWHERQYTVAGYRVGLSPLAYGAWAIGGGVAAMEFGLDWYANGAHPSGTLRNTTQVELPATVMAAAKSKFKDAVSNRDLFVTGKDWEYSPATVDANSAQFLAAQDYAAVDVARFIGVPASAIDAAVQGQSLTYSNVTMNQLDLLVKYLTAPVVRRESYLNAHALPAPRFVKFNTDALLRLDPTARVELVGKQIASWAMTPDEARTLDNRPPLSPADIELLALMKNPPTIGVLP